VHNSLLLIQNGSRSYHPKVIPKTGHPWPSPSQHSQSRQSHHCQQTGREDGEDKVRNFCDRNQKKNYENSNGDQRQD
jgi:hypothetical protein